VLSDTLHAITRARLWIPAKNIEYLNEFHLLNFLSRRGNKKNPPGFWRPPMPDTPAYGLSFRTIPTGQF